MKTRIAAAALAFFLIIPLPGLGEAMKDEVVYALLSATGEPKAVFVVNAFESADVANVTDYGEYAAVLPLGRAEGFAYADGQAAFGMNSGRFEYQGEVGDPDLPWDIGISYMLGGVPVTPAELAGASGLLEGVITITPDARFAGITESLTLQTTVTLPAQNALEIRADKATVAAAGGDRALTFVTLPGQAAQYAFSTTVLDFSMPGIQIAGIRMAMDTEMYQAAAAEALEGTLLENAGGLIGGFLRGMQGQPPVSFTDERNAVRSVQFVILGEGIAKPAAPPAQEAGEAPKTFWQRITSLFGI